MAHSGPGPRRPERGKAGQKTPDQVIKQARRLQAQRERSYREQSLKIHPWICARCGREFTNRNLHELTVHHKDGDHENNPPDGSNWENLCIYCHENEHRRHLDYLEGRGILVGDEEEKGPGLTQNPFAQLAGLLEKKEG